MFKEIFTEAKVKITQNKLDKTKAGVEEITGPEYEFETEFYGGFGIEPLFSVQPIPVKSVIDDVTAYLKKSFKKNRVKTTLLNDSIC
jgi:hypothetical protein